MDIFPVIQKNKTKQHAGKQTYLQATARLRLLRMTRVYMPLPLLPTPGLYKAGDISLKNTATA